MRNSGNSTASVNKIYHSLAPCEGIFKFRHTLLVIKNDEKIIIEMIASCPCQNARSAINWRRGNGQIGPLISKVD